MTTIFRFAILLILIPAAALPVWQQEVHPARRNSVEPEWSELAASIGKMHAAMSSVEPTGDGDTDFVDLMLPHHQAAIDMAKTQLMNGKDPQMRRLAQEIITDQQSEVDLMKLWLKQHSHGSQK